MFKARKNFISRLKTVDAILEIVDARIPQSSSNPMLESLVSGRKPFIKVLNKSDLANDMMTNVWMDHFRNQQKVISIKTTSTNRPLRRDIELVAGKLLPFRGGADKPFRLMVCGIPNVGKSTFINNLAGRKITKVGDEPAITKNEARIDISKHLILWDTPGILWERILHPFCGLLLGLCGSIGRNAIDEAELLELLLPYLLNFRSFKDRYYINETDLEIMNNEGFVNIIGKKIGTLKSGGSADPTKTSNRVISDFRSGKLGKLTLESPDIWALIQKQIKEIDGISSNLHHSTDDR